LPGLGKSDKPDAAYDLLCMCDRIVAFLDAKQVPRVSIIGGSLGGHLGLLLALNHPERVEKLVMMGSTGAWPPPHLLLELGLKLLWNEALVRDYVRTHWDDIYRLMFLHETELTRALYRQQIALRANGSRYAPEGRALARALRSIFYHSCRRRLPDVHIPVLLIWGEKDEIHPPEDALYLRRRLPDARLVIVPGAAHEVMVDQPETFNRVVRAFLEAGTSGVADSLTPH
jgi:pimeloyl-ACP methyl ester carboxylesterase